MALRLINPDLKVLLSVGGWNQRGEAFTEVVKDPVKRSAFVQQAYQFVKSHDFDGFDLDWEYPGLTERGSELEDKQRFSLLVAELRAKFGSELLLTAAVAAGKKAIENGYEVENISKVGPGGFHLLEAVVKIIILI